MIQKMIKLSIIIPVYNVEKYIGRCLESCVNQDLPLDDYEVIIVNDGSQDQSMDIVHQYANSYSNIRIIEQENSGPGAARNNGIRNAKGTYLWFVDSDDDIQNNVIKALTTKALCQDLDVLCFDINIIEKEHSSIYPIYTGNADCCYIGTKFISGVTLLPSPCVALYKREFLEDHSLFFLPNIEHEDFEFTPKSYCLAQRIAYTKTPAYNYWLRTSSRQTTVSIEKRAKRAKDFLVICDSLYQFTKEHIEEGTPAYRTMINKINFAFSQSLRNYTKEVSTIAEYKEKPYYPLDISVEGEKRNRWKYRLINFSIPLYLFAHKLLKK